MKNISCILLENNYFQYNEYIYKHNIFNNIIVYIGSLPNTECIDNMSCYFSDKNNIDNNFLATSNEKILEHIKILERDNIIGGLLT